MFWLASWVGTEKQHGNEENQVSQLIHEDESAKSRELRIIELKEIFAPQEAQNGKATGDAVVQDERWPTESIPCLLVFATQHAQEVRHQKQAGDTTNAKQRE